jgi:15-cis-phytoene synthase/lycopene beta-cyclase
MDDLVDDAPDASTARRAIRQCRIALHRQFTLTFPDNNQPLQPKTKGITTSEAKAIKSIPPVLVTSTGLLPISRLTIDPLLDLLDGFESDLAFTNSTAASPIESESDLELYAYRVAGTVATSVLQLIISHYHPQMSKCKDIERIIKAGSTMGEALQYVNIARDIEEDASIGRVYIPNVWLKDEGLTHGEILANLQGKAVENLRERMLRKAEGCYRASFDAMNELPSDVQGPLKTVVNCYMLIGQVLRENRLEGKIVHGRLKVPISRRIRVAWSSMMEIDNRH